MKTQHSDIYISRTYLLLSKRSDSPSPSGKQNKGVAKQDHSQEAMSCQDKSADKSPGRLAKN